MSTETKEETTEQNVEVEFNSEPSKPDPIQQLIAIATELQKLCPPDQQSKYGYGKYVNVSISGFTELAACIGYGPGCHFKATSLADLKAGLSEYDPEVAKRKRIESLKAQLAELEAA